jgi:glucose-1-phosphate adenylyltransferase
VVVAPADSVYKIDFSKALEFHMMKGSDITIVCKDMPGESDYSKYGLLELGEDGRVLDMEEKPMYTEKTIVSTGIYILRRQLLIELVEKRCRVNIGMIW